MTPDVNLLVAAMREDHPHHSLAFHHVQQQMQLAVQRPRTASILLLGSVVAGFMRVVTHAQVFKEPSSMQQASQFVDALLACPGVSFQAAGSAWPAFRDLCLKAGDKPQMVSDAWIAATAAQLGEVVHTFDRDFTKLLPPEKVFLLNR